MKIDEMLASMSNESLANIIRLALAHSPTRTYELLRVAIIHEYRHEIELRYRFVDSVINRMVTMVDPEVQDWVRWAYEDDSTGD